MDAEYIISQLLQLAAQAVLAGQVEYASKVCVALAALTDCTDEQVFEAVKVRINVITEFANEVLADIDAL